MRDIMRQGLVDCECGNLYHFKSIREEIPCMMCYKMNPNNGEIVIEVEAHLPEEGE